MKPIEDSDAEKIGPNALIEPSPEPGIFEKIESITDAIEKGDNIGELAEAMPVKVISDFIHQTDLPWSESFHHVDCGHMPYELYLREGRLRSLIDRLRQIQVIDSTIEDGKIPIAEIHCPKVDGCKAFYSQKTSSKNDSFLGLKIAGFGGGSGRSCKIGMGYRIPAVKECLYVLAPIKVRVDACTGPRGNFNRITILEIGNGYHLDSIHPEADHCQTPLKQLKAQQWKVLPYPVRYQNDPTEFEFNTEIGQQWNHSLGINFRTINIGLNVSIKVIKKFGYEYKLVGPKKYNAFIKPDTLGYAWTWK